jgi:hypothetical protein
MDSATFEELLEKFESLSPEEREAEIEFANQYLASEEGRHEFGDLLIARNIIRS